MMLAVFASKPISIPPWIFALMKRNAYAIPHAPNTVAASISFSSMVTTSPRFLKRSFTYFISFSDALLLQTHVILCCMAIAVLGIARKRGTFC